jgi:hypothetical protein
MRSLWPAVLTGTPASLKTFSVSKKSPMWSPWSCVSRTSTASGFLPATYCAKPCALAYSGGFATLKRLHPALFQNHASAYAICL